MGFLSKVKEPGFILLQTIYRMLTSNMSSLCGLVKPKSEPVFCGRFWKSSLSVVLEQWDGSCVEGTPQSRAGYLSKLSLKEGQICHLSPEYWLCRTAGSGHSYTTPSKVLAEFVIKRGKALSPVSRILALAGRGFFSGQSAGMVEQSLWWFYIRILMMIMVMIPFHNICYTTSYIFFFFLKCIIA